MNNLLMLNLGNVIKIKDSNDAYAGEQIEIFSEKSLTPIEVFEKLSINYNISKVIRIKLFFDRNNELAMFITIIK